MELILALTTEADLKKGRQLAEIILERRLAACASFHKVNSHYWWNGQLEHSEEVQILFKTSKSYLALLRKTVLGLHSYDTPEFLHWSVSANQTYREWMDSELK